MLCNNAGFDCVSISINSLIGLNSTIFVLSEAQYIDQLLILLLFFLCVQTVPACQNLYKNSFTYFVLQDDKSLRFDDAIGFIGNFLFDLPLIIIV